MGDIMRIATLLILAVALQGCATFDASETHQNIARGRSIVSDALSKPGAQERVTLSYAGGQGEREAFSGAAIEGDQVCGLRVAGTLEPIYVHPRGGGVQLYAMEWIELPHERQDRRCVSLARVSKAKVGDDPGFLGLRLN
ncbi:hypothetical protein D8I30_12115 [Brevundimonas naejangsanensis]|uniref:Lipoprotein n=1 Tax=Brevundimonas naejangsanensis TaxID=588932 RepID=A0A494RRB7_9CAUL|nr:hypothetical protein [Brevundimonas naejangsanensis]AYG95836.1 hypothetical protein D8I30_12115 [Brevundimonas naejangsanensis]